MRILLVHRNFPGQFRYLGPALVRAGHQVGVLTWKDNQNPRTLPTALYGTPTAPAPGIGSFYSQHVDIGAAAARAAQALRQKGDPPPEVVLGSINWGETLFLRDIWPEARHLGYAEFFYATRGHDTGFDPEFVRGGVESDIRTVARTGHLLLAASRADALLSPTHWQASTFPAEIRPKISVIHDGVDTDRIAPAPASYQVPGGPLLKTGDEVLTFVNRNLEPYRGYHTLMRALPAVMAARPNLQVVMVGGHGTGYGPGPGKDRSWKQVFLDEVADRVDRSRIHYVGRIPYPDLLNVLRVGRAHAYLSYPFVLSWSMLEAMSLGCLVVGSDTTPVAEAIEDGVTGHLVDFFDVDGWSQKLIEVLSDPQAQMPLRQAARQHIVDTYDLKTVCLPKLLGYVEGT